LAAEREEQIGRAKDARLALAWRPKRAQFHLALAYESGEGIENYFSEDCKW
jgi:hypothetical protein